MVALEERMAETLRKEGLADLQVGCIAGNASSWEQRATGFDQVSLPVMLDTDGVAYIYDTLDEYAIVLVDKQGRLVTKEDDSDESMNRLVQRARELHAE